MFIYFSSRDTFYFFSLFQRGIGKLEVKSPICALGISEYCGSVCCFVTLSGFILFCTELSPCLTHFIPKFHLDLNLESFWWSSSSSSKALYSWFDFPPKEKKYTLKTLQFLQLQHLACSFGRFEVFLCFSFCFRKNVHVRYKIEGKILCYFFAIMQYHNDPFLFSFFLLLFLSSALRFSMMITIFIIINNSSRW